MRDANSQDLLLLSKLVLVLAVALLIAGVIWHGVSAASLDRFWRDLLDRPSSAMRFRFVLQPLMAAIAAIHDARADARANRAPFFLTILVNPLERLGRLSEGLNATARIVLLGVVMDVIYQYLVLGIFYPGEALVTALFLAFLPYVVIRGPALRAIKKLESLKSRGGQGRSTRKEPNMIQARDPAQRFEVRSTADTHFGWIRTILSVERTMMSWQRTAIAMIGFGFAIVQYFERLGQSPGVRPPAFPDAPKYMGLALIGCGILALVISIYQYRWTQRYLCASSFESIAGMTEEGRHSPVLAVAIVLILIGLSAFVAILFRLA